MPPCRLSSQIFRPLFSKNRPSPSPDEKDARAISRALLRDRITVRGTPRRSLPRRRWQATQPASSPPPRRRGSRSGSTAPRRGCASIHLPIRPRPKRSRPSASGGPACQGTSALRRRQSARAIGRTSGSFRAKRSAKTATCGTPNAASFVGQPVRPRAVHASTTTAGSFVKSKSPLARRGAHGVIDAKRVLRMALCPRGASATTGSSSVRPASCRFARIDRDGSILRARDGVEVGWLSGAFDRRRNRRAAALLLLDACSLDID